jgi:hypothetical protein
MIKKPEHSVIFDVLAKCPDFYLHAKLQKL